MGRSNTLVAMMAGAALAGGVMYLKKLNQEQTKAASDTLDAELSELKKEAATEKAGWRASYTIDGEELDANVIKTRFKEETAKAVENFRADAKIASEEILTGLKKAIADMKVAVDGARKAAAERRAVMEEDSLRKEEGCCEEAQEGCCCEEMTEGECGCEKMKDLTGDSES